MPRARVFLDSSIIITALLSSQGGSFYILNQLKDSFIFQINEYVWAEVLEIIQNKFNSPALMRTQLFLLLGTTQAQVLSNPSQRLVNLAAKYISLNDAPILAAALEHSDYLLTLDNEFFKNEIAVMTKIKSLTILKPRDFIEKYRREK